LNGSKGLLQAEWIDLTNMSERSLGAVSKTPSAMLGTSRIKLDWGAVEMILDHLREAGATGLVIIGGNDSADTAMRLDEVAERQYEALHVVLAPKTIDNDLPGTDHTPGYGSAARCLANVVRNAFWDSRSATDLYPVKFIEVAGRNAGWLAAAAGLGFAGANRDDALLTLLPERPPKSIGMVIEQVAQRVQDRGFAICVVPETLKLADGSPLSGRDAQHVDPFGHPYHLPPAMVLAEQYREAHGVNARFERPGSFVRMSGGSAVDRDEAEAVGEAAVDALVAGERSVMVTLVREEALQYRCRTGLTSLATVANQERPLDDTFIGEDGMSATSSFAAYALPLLGADPFPPYWTRP
jgi:6-phosphofructokinase 1